MRLLIIMLTTVIATPFTQAEIPGESRQRLRNSSPEVAQHIQGLSKDDMQSLFLPNMMIPSFVGLKFNNAEEATYQQALDDLKGMIMTTCAEGAKYCFREQQLASYLSSHDDVSSLAPSSSLEKATAARKIIGQIQLYTQSDLTSVAKFLSTLDKGKVDFLFQQMFGPGFGDADGTYKQAFDDLRLMLTQACPESASVCFKSGMVEAYLTNSKVPPSTSEAKARAAAEILAKVAKDIKPDTPRAGFVKLNNEQQGSINWLKYYLALSDDHWIPIYLLSASATNSEGTEGVEANLLDRNGGIINFKYASERAIYPWGLCNFNRSLRGGCYIVWEAGAKVLTIDDANGNSEYEYASYGSAGLDFEFPIFPDLAAKTDPDTPFNIDPAGNLLIGMSINGLYTSTDKIREFYLINGETAQLDINEFTSYVDWRVGFQITGKISIEAGGIAWSDSETLKNNNYVRVGYNHLLDI